MPADGMTQKGRRQHCSPALAQYLLSLEHSAESAEEDVDGPESLSPSPVSWEGDGEPRSPPHDCHEEPSGPSYEDQADKAARHRAAEWTSRLIRVGVPWPMGGDVWPPHGPMPGEPEIVEELVDSLADFQLTVRSCLRLLQGSLALLCGRGITVPMAPIAALLMNEPGIEQQALHSCATVRDLAGALHRSLVGVASQASHLHQEGPWCAPDCHAAVKRLRSLESSARDAGGVHLSRLQEASATWSRAVAALLPCLLLLHRPDAAAIPGPLSSLAGSLHHASLTLRLASRLPPVPPSASAPAEQAGAGPPHDGPSPSLKRSLRSLRQGLAVCRAQAEERFVSCFLAECAATDVLRNVEAVDEEDEGRQQEGLLLRRVQELRGLVERMEGHAASHQASAGSGGPVAEAGRLVDRVLHLLVSGEQQGPTTGEARAETAEELHETRQENREGVSCRPEGMEAAGRGPERWACEATGEGQEAEEGGADEEEEVEEVYAAWGGTEEEEAGGSGAQGRDGSSGGESVCVAGRGVMEELRGALARRGGRGEARVKCQGCMRVEEARDDEGEACRPPPASFSSPTTTHAPATLSRPCEPASGRQDSDRTSKPEGGWWAELTARIGAGPIAAAALGQAESSCYYVGGGGSDDEDEDGTDDDDDRGARGGSLPHGED